MAELPLEMRENVAAGVAAIGDLSNDRFTLKTRDCW